MTDQSIEQLAREIAESANLEWANDSGGPDIAHRAARLALLEGERRERERCAKLVEGWNGKTADGNTFLIAAAIRSAMP